MHMYMYMCVYMYICIYVYIYIYINKYTCRRVSEAAKLVDDMLELKYVFNINTEDNTNKQQENNNIQ